MELQNIRIIRSIDAVSETLGYSLILGILIVFVGVMVVVSYPILTSIKNSAFTEAQIESLTMLDNRITMVAFGGSPSQLTRMDLNGGSMNVYNDTSNRLTITVANTSGYQREIFNKSIGTVEYSIDDYTIAYENGGMFRKYKTGETLMLSPPEFYYNGETLTFPIIQIDTKTSIAGKGVVDIYSNSGSDPWMIYPNLTSPDDLVNPLYGKQIKIRLKSDYYRAWGSYIEERTEAIPLLNDVTHEVLVAFNAKPSKNPTELVMPVEVIGIDTSNSTPLNNISFNLSNATSDMHVTLRAPTSTSNDFMIDVQKNGGLGTAGLTIIVMYNKGGYNETWKSDTYAWITDDFTNIDLLNSSANATYESNGDSGTWINETYPYNKTYTKFVCCNGPVPLNILLQHYIKLISDTGTFALYTGTQPGDPEWGKGFEPGNSTYVLDYTIMPPTINYLHIVDHDVNIGFR